MKTSAPDGTRHEAPVEGPLSAETVRTRASEEAERAVAALELALRENDLHPSPAGTLQVAALAERAWRLVRAAAAKCRVDGRPGA